MGHLVSLVHRRAELVNQCLGARGLQDIIDHHSKNREVAVGRKKEHAGVTQGLSVTEGTDSALQMKIEQPRSLLEAIKGTQALEYIFRRDINAVWYK